jgi:hypothetical protein
LRVTPIGNRQCLNWQSAMVLLYPVPLDSSSLLSHSVG